MFTKRAIVVAVAALGLLGALSGSALADEWNQKTIFTFSGPVEIPGQVLPAGTYVFKLADSQSDRNIVQVFSRDERHLYGTFIAVPDERLKPAGKPIITFDERPGDSPEAVKAWFYPGMSYEHEFVYPKPRAAVLAKTHNTPVPSMPAELSASTTQPVASMTAPAVVALKQAPLKAQTPAEEEVEITEVISRPTLVAVAVPPATLPAELPATASSLPVVALAGLACLSVAAALALARVRSRA